MVGAKEPSTIWWESLVDMNDSDADVKEQIQQVKDSVAKICQQKLKEHKCEGVVPGTFIICGEDDYQYCSDACLEIAKKVKDIQSKK